MNCPFHNLPLERLEITQGDRLLGYIFICPMGEWGSMGLEACDYVLDGDMEGNPVEEKFEQLEMLL